MKLSIVIPAFNEESRLPVTLEDYGRFFCDRFGDDVEIIVVVNHCSDDTEVVARRAAEPWPQISIVAVADRIGKGGAVGLGMRRAIGELVGFVDADGATPPESFHTMLEHIGDNGCIIGSRWIEGAVISPKQPWIRRIASRVLNRLFVYGLFGLPLRDSQCGAKIFRAEVLNMLLPELKEPGWAFDIDLLCRIRRLGYGIREFPIAWHHVPGNTTTFMLMSLQMFASVWRVKRAFVREG